MIFSPLSQPAYNRRKNIYFSDVYPNELPANKSSLLVDPHREMGAQPLDSAVPKPSVGFNDIDLGQDWLQNPDEDEDAHKRHKRAVKTRRFCSWA